MANSPPPSQDIPLHNTGPPDTGNGSGRPVVASNVDAQNGPASQVPTFYPAPRTTKHTLMGVRAAESHAQKGNDPFDYEQKYSDDEEYKEMGPMARVWKVFLDECGKFDTEMVENWRDALDVLLVFAGLFSAVVTTFVSQTSQSLQPNFQEINASKMNEVSELIRAAFLNGTDGVMSVPRSTNTAAAFRPSRSALWVNGLWFTSLALSLTTALIAVLTKQWIHQYLSVPSGTPRDRCRIRQFRYTSLQNWHVPVIIGLLPVLMHIALGVFFAGLTVFLCTLDTTIASVIGAIAAAAFGVYITTNLLPLFKPGCPYKTPLTIHSHSLSRYLWHQLEPIRQWFDPPLAPPDPSTYAGYVFRKDGAPSTELPSLKALERQRVDSDASDIDIQCLSWLFGTSSNSSVQRVVMQAISNLPLQSSRAIRDSIPSLRATVTNIVESIEGKVTERPVYERLFRALSRVEDEFALPRCPTEPEPGDQRLSILADPDNSPLQAAEFLRAQLVKSTIDLDVLSWALIMHSALHRGAGWLDVDVDHSEVWKALLPLLITAHRCDERTNCDHSRKELVTLTVKYPFGLNKFPLTILDAEGTEKAVSLSDAIQHFMLPSFANLVLNEYDSSLGARFPPDLPSDLAIQLNLLTSRAVRAIDLSKKALWQRIEIFVGIRSPTGHDTVIRHPSIIMPLFDALLDVLHEDDFIETDTLSFHQKMDVCLFLFHTFNLEPNLQPYMYPVITPAVLQDIIQLSFTPSSAMLPSPLVTDMLNFLTLSLSPLSADIYRLLREREWLEEIEKVLLSWRSTSGRQRQEYFYDLSYPFLACAFVDGLEALSYVGAAEHSVTLRYLTPSNILRLSKLILFADADRRKSLQTLAGIVGETVWAVCSKALSTFLETENAQATFKYYSNALRGYDPFNFRVLLRYETYNNLKEFLRQTAQQPRRSVGPNTNSPSCRPLGVQPELPDPSPVLNCSSSMNNRRHCETQIEIV